MNRRHARLLQGGNEIDGHTAAGLYLDAPRGVFGQLPQAAQTIRDACGATRGEHAGEAKFDQGIQRGELIVEHVERTMIRDLHLAIAAHGLVAGGLGVIDHGNIINGALGAATEIGHVSIDINGKPCDCGNVGCLERYCSTPAIHEMILKEDDLIADAGTMTHLQACRALFALARGGDKRAIALIKRVARYVGFGCITIFNSFNPSQIVIGDIVAEAGQLLLDEVHKVIDKHVIHELNDTTAITLSALPADAALNGAAAVAINQFLDHPSQFFELS